MSTSTSKHKSITKKTTTQKGTRHFKKKPVTARVVFNEISKLVTQRSLSILQASKIVAAAHGITPGGRTGQSIVASRNILKSITRTDFFFILTKKSFS